MEENVIAHLKDNVRYYRRRMKISQQVLAELCGLSTTYIAEIELGRRHPSLRTLIKMAGVFQIPVHMLLINPDDNRNEAVEQFSQDLEKKLVEVIEDMRKRY